MLFFVSKTSCWDESIPPIEGAESVWVHRTHKKNFSTLDEWRKKHPKDFNRDIIEMSETPQGCYMVLNERDRRWITGVSDLYTFIKNNGKCVLNAPEEYGFKGVMSIEIYDCRRE